MKTLHYTSRNLWLVISFCCVVWITACKSRSTPPAEATETIENPKPATEPQTDSLKNELDKQREQRLKNKR